MNSDENVDTQVIPKNLITFIMGDFSNCTLKQTVFFLKANASLRKEKKRDA